MTDDNDLEQEFDAVSEELVIQVNEKLKQAADLIKEAAKIARDNGKELVDLDDEGHPNYDNPFDTGLIEGAMESAGWSTSSWYC